jgi:galactosamine-6-phosphate isomerase
MRFERNRKPQPPPPAVHATPGAPVTHIPFTLQVAPDYEAMSEAASGFIAAEIKRQPDSLLGVASGASPARAYELLAERGRTEPQLISRIRFITLDEWCGLALNDPASCQTYVREKLVKPLRIGPDRFFAWNSQPADPQAECRQVADWLAANGPISLCILGLGANGHLGFNEPADKLQAGPHRAELSETSLTHSMLGQAGRNARFGLTLGMADILQSRKVILLVSGPHKAEQMRYFFMQQISTHFPASLLWLHPRLTIFSDRAAASLLHEELLP